ncbi:MAG: hypothetical protein B7Z16_18860, partial [Algoriphagus sp. 32-45-6]
QIPVRIVYDDEVPVVVRSTSTPPIVKMASIDVGVLKKEDKQEEGLGIPPRFGKDIDVNLYIIEFR